MGGARILQRAAPTRFSIWDFLRFEKCRFIFFAVTGFLAFLPYSSVFCRLYFAAYLINVCFVDRGLRLIAAAAMSQLDSERQVVIVEIWLTPAII